MAFDRKLLNDNEEILLDLNPHWWFITPQAAIVVLAIVVAVAALALDVPSVLQWVLMIVVVAAAANLAVRTLRWLGVNFVITTDRLIFRSGVIAKRGIEIPLERINTVFYAQSLFERIVGSGHLTVESAGEGGQQHFADVRHPQRVQQQIYKAMEIDKSQNFRAMAEAHGASAFPGATTAPLSIPEQIDQLDELRVRGVITDVEFQAKKTELLNRM